jgi:hypothetical protein
VQPVSWRALVAAAIGVVLGACNWVVDAADYRVTSESERCAPLAGNPCDVAPQCGCTSGQACQLLETGNGATECTASGSIAVGRACALNRDCVKGASCVSGLCAPYCETRADCGSVRFVDCFGLFGVDGERVEGARACTLGHCNPKDPQNRAGDPDFTACVATDTCAPLSEGEVAGGTTCIAAGTVGIGARCQALTDCVPGAYCTPWEEGGPAFCSKYCFRDESCGAKTCGVFSLPLSVATSDGLVTLGVCDPR